MEKGAGDLMAKKKAKAKIKTDRVELRVACDLPEGIKKAELKKLISDALAKCALQNVKSEFI